MYLFVKDNRFKMKMWSDSRLVNKQAIFCLCTKCIKEDETIGTVCPTHKRFMEATRYLQVTAPVFACADFKETPLRDNVLDTLYEPSQESVEHYRAKFAVDWETQKKLWNIDDNLQPIGQPKVI